MKLQAITFSVLLIILSALQGCSQGSKKQQQDDQVKLGVRQYLLKLPANYQPQQEYKLLLVFHGSGGRANQMQQLTQFERYSEDYIVAYPNSLEVEWNEGCDCNIAHRKGADDLAFVDEVIADIGSKHKLASGEVYAAGFSQGGLFVQNLACNRSSAFKAVAIVAAPMSVQLAASCYAEQPLSVLMIQGEADNVLPYYGMEHSNFGLIGAQPALRLHAEMHQSLPYPLRKALPQQDAGLISYSNGEQKFQLIHIKNGGHSWDFRNLMSSKTILSFFANLTKPEMPEYSSQLNVAERVFHVRTMGQQHTGPAVVLLAGPNENYHSDSAWFAALQPLLAQQYRVHSIDRAGNAFSSPTDSPSYRQFAEDLPAILQQLNEKQVILVAFSSAAISARLLQDSNPQQLDIKAMLYVDPDIPLPHSLSLYQGYPVDWYLANLDALIPHLGKGAWTERTLAKITAEHEHAQQLVANHASLMDWQYFEQISQLRLLIPHQQARAREIAAYSADLDAYARLPMVSAIPVSVIDSDFESVQIAAAEDQATAEALQQWQQEGSAWSAEQASLSNGQYVALTDSDHLVTLEQPQQIKQALEWLFNQLQLN